MRTLLTLSIALLLLVVFTGCTREEQTSGETMYPTESSDQEDTTNDLTEEEMRLMIANANYCTTADECVYVGTQCPFGCNIYANEKEAERIKDALDSFQSDCVYRCAACQGVQCVDNSCQAVCP